MVQKGSLVAADRLRFDFSHFQPVYAARARARSKRLVNAQIRANAAAATRLMDYEQAIAAERWRCSARSTSSKVRVLSIGDFSTELCGGTHVARAGEIGLFHILSESGVAAGVRRIEALTGQAALDYMCIELDTLLGELRAAAAWLARRSGGQGARCARADSQPSRRRTARSRTGSRSGRARTSRPVRSTSAA